MARDRVAVKSPVRRVIPPDFRQTPALLRERNALCDPAISRDPLFECRIVELLMQAKRRKQFALLGLRRIELVRDASVELHV